MNEERGWVTSSENQVYRGGPCSVSVWRTLHRFAAGEQISYYSEVLCENLAIL